MISLDTNVLIYAVDDRRPIRRDSARWILDAGLAGESVLGLQVCGEFFRVATGKLRMPATVARRHVQVFLNGFTLFSASRSTVEAAVDLAASGELSYWNANLICAAEAAGCTHLLSEDMSDGYRHGRLQVVNPFAGDALSSGARSLFDL